MRLYILVFSFLFLSGTLFSQEIVFKIKEIEIRNIKYKEDISEGPYGPLLHVTYELHNNTSDVINLSNIEYYIEFFYEHHLYTISPYYYLALDKNVNPNEKIEKEIDFLLLRNTPMYIEAKPGTKLNYTNTLLKTLPTLKLKLKIKNMVFEASSIENVKIF